LFSDVGPVKKVILVRPKGQEKHKGFGFVTFALREDAQSAVDKLNGTEVDAKTLKVRVGAGAGPSPAPWAAPRARAAPWRPPGGEGG